MPWRPVNYGLGHITTRLCQTRLHEECKQEQTSAAALMCCEYAHKHQLGMRELQDWRVVARAKWRPPTLEESQLRSREPEHGSKTMVDRGCTCARCVAQRPIQDVSAKPPPVLRPTAPPVGPPAKQGAPSPGPETWHDAAFAAQKAPPPRLPVQAGPPNSPPPPVKAVPPYEPCGVVYSRGGTLIKSPPVHINQPDRTRRPPEEVRPAVPNVMLTRPSHACPNTFALFPSIISS